MLTVHTFARRMVFVVIPGGDAGLRQTGISRILFGTAAGSVSCTRPRAPARPALLTASQPCTGSFRPQINRGVIRTRGRSSRLGAFIRPVRTGSGVGVDKQPERHEVEGTPRTCTCHPRSIHRRSRNNRGLTKSTARRCRTRRIQIRIGCVVACHGDVGMVIRMPYRRIASGFGPLFDGLIAAPRLWPAVHKDGVVRLRCGIEPGHTGWCNMT